MNRREVLTRANARASARYRTTITDNELSDVLESKIVKAPEKRGRIRNWTWREYRQLLEIARLKSLGVSDHAEIRWMLWAKGQNVAPMKFDHDDRNYLANLIDQRFARLFRGIHSTYPEVKNRSPDGYPAQAVLSKMGQLDECLNGIVEYDRQELLGFYELLRYGNSVQTEIVAPSAGRIGRWMASSLKFRIRVPVGLVMRFFGPHIVRFASGMARQPDGRSSAVARSILNATPEQFEHARRLLGLAARMFRRMGLKKAAVSLLHPTWRLPMLVLAVHLVRLQSRQRRPWLPSVAEIDLAEGVLLN